MKEYLIKVILKWMYGITKEQWEYALNYVMIAATELKDKTGSEKKEYVLNEIKKQYRFIKSKALNVLIELSLGYLIKNKAIPE